MCAQPGGWKYDKRGNPYVSCPYCQIKIFPHGLAAVAAIEMNHQLVMSCLSSYRARIRATLVRRLSNPSLAMPTVRPLMPRTAPAMPRR